MSDDSRLEVKLVDAGLRSKQLASELARVQVRAFADDAVMRYMRRQRYRDPTPRDLETLIRRKAREIWQWFHLSDTVVWAYFVESLPVGYVCYRLSSSMAKLMPWPSSRLAAALVTISRNFLVLCDLVWKPAWSPCRLVSVAVHTNRALYSYYEGRGIPSYINELVVDPQFQRRGIGSALVQFSLEYLKSLREMPLRCFVFASESAESLYLKQGFEIKERVNFNPRGQDVIALFMDLSVVSQPS